MTYHIYIFRGEVLCAKLPLSRGPLHFRCTIPPNILDTHAPIIHAIMHFGTDLAENVGLIRVWAWVGTAQIVDRSEAPKILGGARDLHEGVGCRSRILSQQHNYMVLG